MKEQNGFNHDKICLCNHQSKKAWQAQKFFAKTESELQTTPTLSCVLHKMLRFTCFTSFFHFIVDKLPQVSKIMHGFDSCCNEAPKTVTKLFRK